MTTPEPDPPAGDLTAETINRNWTELVQELRSTQTGVQVLTGFLLAVPFTTCGVVFLAFDLAINQVVGTVASLVALLGYVVLWIVVPLRAHPPSGWQ